MDSNYTLLIQKLDAFIRKHYLNNLLRGLIYSSAIIIGTFIALNLLEYQLYMSSLARKFLFYGFLAGSAGLIYWLVGLPLLHYYRLGKIISHEQAAQIIGQHFSDVKDKLLNILQLKKQTESVSDKALIEASISQKIESIKLVPFTAAVDLRGNRKYLRYLAAPLLVFIAIMLAAPNIIRDGTTRLIYNNDHYEKPAPFQFSVENPSLRVVQFENFALEVSVSGDIIPDNVFIKVDGYSYKMNKKSPTNWQHNFINIQKSQDFVLTAAGFDSKLYSIEVLPKPMIVNFDVHLDYPAYTGKKNETVKNIGDLTVPVGTKASWELSAQSTEEIQFNFEEKQVAATRSGEKLFTLSETLMKGGYYTVKISNKHLKDADSISYSLSVIPDMHPSINVQPIEDTANLRYLYFIGEISDDYGLNRLQLKHKIIKEGQKEPDDYTSTAISFNKGQYAQFSHYWDLKTLDLKPGESIVYFFEVWDNDAINGSKSTRSTTLQFRMPTLDELEKENKESNEKIKTDLDQSLSKAEELKNEIQAIQEKLLQKKNLNWEDKKSVEEMLQKQKDLEKNLQQLQDEFTKNISQQQEFKNINEEIVQKQQKLQELFNELLSDEMKEMYEKLQSLMDQLNPDELMEELKDFELSQEQLAAELDRMLELFKQLEFEQKAGETISKLEELAKKQEQLSEDTRNQTKSNEELSEEQKKINEEFEKVEEALKELEDIKKELGDNEAFEQTKEDAEQTKQEMKKGSENLQQNKNKKASENQKNAADKMEEMAQQLGDMMDMMQMEQMEMDMRAIRQLLENLITLSYDQEDLMLTISKTNINDPKYVELTQQQFKIKDDTELVKDSLYALSKRVFQLQTFINKEVTEIYKNLERAIGDLAERRRNDATVRQQYVMTGYNNLALMLSEVMQQMQQQMASQMTGSQMCQKESKGKPSPKMGELQQQMNEQLSKMQEQMKKGPQEGGKGGMSKEVAEMAAKQAAIREALKKLNQEENSDGSLGDLEKLIDEMNKTETELYNKNLTEQMMLRQQEILTRLLEVDESLREREQDDKRQSQTADEIARQTPPSLEEYLKQREAEIQLYKTVPPALKPYYRQMIENYFKNISF